MSQVLSMYGSTSAGMDIGVARMPMTTLQKRPGYHLQEIHSDFDSVEWYPATTRRCRCSHANTEVKLTNAESTCLERPGEARRQSIVFASRKPQRNGIRRIPIRILRLAVELLNKETHHRDVMSFFIKSRPAIHRKFFEFPLIQTCGQRRQSLVVAPTRPLGVTLR